MQPPGRRLRIAHVTTVDMSLALLLGTELSYLVEQGHEVYAVSSPGPYVPRVTSTGARFVPVPALTRSWDLRSDLHAFGQLVRTFRDLDLDVVHTHTPKAGVMGRIAARLAGVPVVVNTCHGLWARAADPLPKRIFVLALEALAARFSGYELFQNGEDEQTLRRVLKRGRHAVVGNGVDLERFRFDPAGRARLRALWGVAEDEILIGTVGRRVREKGLSEFIAAATALSDRARFVWVGPQDETNPSVTAAAEGTVLFAGEVVDMPAAYSAFDIFVLASHREGFSRASMEAAACARPLVLTDIRGCRDLGVAGRDLILVPPRDPAALAGTLATLLEDHERRTLLAKAARKRARTHFDQRRVARRSLTTYTEVIASRSSRSTIHRNSDGRAVVLHVLPEDRRRGAQVYAGQLRDALANHPTQRHLAVTLFEGPPGALRPDIELGVQSGAARRVLNPRAVVRLRRLIRRLGPAAVVAHGGEPLKYAVAASGSTQIIYYKVGLSTGELARRSRLLLYRWLASHAAHVVAVSDDIARQVTETLHVPPARVSIIPNGRDEHLFHPPGPDEHRDDPPLVLWVGQFEPGKRPRLFIETVAHLREASTVSFTAAMAGDGPLRAGLAPDAARAGVELLGTRPDVPDLLRRASVLVFTSAGDTEGMPGVLVEAGLSGVPVVTTKAAGVTDVVIDGETGHVVDFDDTTSIGASVATLLADAATRELLGRQARARCATRFGQSTTTMAWIDLTSSNPPRTNQLRVMHVIDGIHPGGGAEASLVASLAPLRDRGIDGEVVCLYDRPGPEIVRAQGFQVRVLPQGSRLRKLAVLRGLIRMAQPDVVHATLIESTFLTRIASLGLPVARLDSLVSTTYDPIRVALRKRETSSLKTTGVHVIDRLTSRGVQHFHALSRAVAEDAIGQLNIPMERVTIIPRGRSDSALGRRSTERRLAARESLELTDKDFVILNVGRQDRAKAQADLIAAFEHLADKEPNAILLIAGGEGNATSELNQLVVACRHRARIQLLGHRSDVPELLCAADVFAFPSLYEGSPGALIEALALECPIVGSDTPAVAEVLGHGAFGSQVPQGDPVSLSHALFAVMNSPDRVAELTRAGRQRFEQFYELDGVIGRTAALYRALVGTEPDTSVGWKGGVYGKRQDESGRVMIGSRPVDSTCPDTSPGRLEESASEIGRPPCDGPQPIGAIGPAGASTTSGRVRSKPRGSS